VSRNTDELVSAGIAVGQQLPPFDLAVTATRIVAGAIASRDFMPAHHDKGFAAAQGAPDIFMNILTTNGLVSRFVTDWAGPECMVKKIAIRLGVPVFPGQTLKFTGEVTGKRIEASEAVVEVALRAATEYGDHATGTVVLTLPLD
jgi:acyl dehydratase